MLQIQSIHAFLQSNTIAVVGVSRKGDIPANAILKKFIDGGYKTYPVNPNAKEVDGIQCYATLETLPEKPDAVMFAAKPEISSKIIDDCISLGVRKVWMHRGIGEGSYSTEAEKKCNENGIEVITNGCPMMFVKPVDPFHKILRWFKNF